MNIKTVLVTSLRFFAATVVYLACFIGASGIALSSIAIAQPPPAEASAAGVALVAVALLNPATLAYIILRSRWNGWRLSLVTAFVLYGVLTFMSQIETLAFPAVADRLPPGMLRGLFVLGALLAAPFAPLAVLILGKWKKDPSADEPNTRLIMPVGEWAWKLAAIVVAYELLYFGFGYFVAWKNPAVQAYYGGTDPGSFIAQMANVVRDTPWLPLLQAVRALLWTLMALPVIRMMKGRAWETSLAVGLLFAVIMSAQLLFPNPYMPREVSTAHLIETASSNFIFGALLAGLMLWRLLWNIKTEQALPPV